MADPAGPARGTEEFYVGYLPLPTGHRVFLRFVLPAILWLMVAMAALIAARMRDAGTGVWESSERRVFVGTLDVSPYPTLRQAREMGGADAPLGSFLLVEAGKLGGRAGLVEMQGRTVQVAGSILRRDGRAMIELAPGENAVRPDSDTAVPLSARIAAGHTTLRGEIVDSKCYLGAMRPGDGKTHRACAQLCIAGGLPPMLVTRDAGGNASYYLLIAPGGTAANDLVRQFVAEPVEVSGTLERVEDLVFIRLDAGGIQRL